MDFSEGTFKELMVSDCATRWEVGSVLQNLLAVVEGMGDLGRGVESGNSNRGIMVWDSIYLCRKAPMYYHSPSV